MQEQNKNNIVENVNIKDVNVANENENQVAEQAQPITPIKKKNTLLIVLQVIVAVLFVGLTAFLVGGLINEINTPPANTENTIDLSGLGLALYLIIVIILIGGAGYLLNTILSIVGLIISLSKRKDGVGKGTIIYFIIFIALPIITEALLILLTINYSNNRN